MGDVWSSLLPLAAAGALVPAQIAITILLLRAPSGLAKAAAFVGGMTCIRLLQGIIFGVLLSEAVGNEGAGGPGTIGSVLMLALGLVFIAAALRSLLAEDDPDAPPPRWVSMMDSVTAPKAFALGAGFLAVAPKFWVFTLSGIAVIEEADLQRGTATLAFLLFVALSQAVVLAILVAGVVAPHRSAVALDSISGWLERNNRAILVVIGLVFGTWFALKGLRGLGVV